jgi:hypothetical protein
MNENIKNLHNEYKNVFKSKISIRIFSIICKGLKEQKKELSLENINNSYKEIRKGVREAMENEYIINNYPMPKNRESLISKVNDVINKVNKKRKLKPRDFDDVFIQAKLMGYKIKEIAKIFNPLNLTSENIKKRIQRSLYEKNKIRGILGTTKELIINRVIENRYSHKK